MLEKLGQNMPCWCGSGKKYRDCHSALDVKLAEMRRGGQVVPTRKMIKNAEQIARIRESCRVNIAVLDAVAQAIHPGMALSEINDIVNDVTYSHGAIPAPLHYEGYPFSVCTSVNEQVCHGFPTRHVHLREGDIVNVDCSTILDGYFSDSSRMFCIGEVSPEREKLVRVTRECVEKAIAVVRPFGHLGDIGEVIETYAGENGYTVVENIGGHGCGIAFHEDPYVCHVGRAGTGMVLVPGMIFTIEPMVNAGRSDVVTSAANGWEVTTADGRDSAQWENMVLVTEEGCEVLCW